MPVDTPRPEYNRMQSKWQRVRDCFDGSDAVKARTTAYLPRLSSHTRKPELYTDYINRALFYNAMRRTVVGLAGAIHQKAPVMTCPAIMVDDLKDVTLGQLPAECFCLDLTKELLITGRAGVLVEMPSKESADERPYWCLYRAEDIISWQTTQVGGDQKLITVVLRGQRETRDPSDPYSVVMVDQIRLLTLGPDYAQYVFEKAPTEPEWKQVSSYAPLRRKKPLDFIPFVFASPEGLSIAPQSPPLLDLADINLSHYRASADLKHGLHLAALPTPWLAGSTANPDESDSITLGSGTALILAVGGQAGMLEVSGPGFAAIRADMQDMEKQMATQGARLLEASTTNETATAVSMRHAGEHASLRSLAQSSEMVITQVMKYHSYWVGIGDDPTKEEAGCELNKDFFNLKATSDEIRTALLNLQAEKISYATFYGVLQHGGWAREGVTAEDELKQIMAEAGRPTQPEPEPEPEPELDLRYA